jgi:hypothetical protein
LWRAERHGARLLPWSLLFYFCQLLPRVILLVFPLVSAAIGDENYFKFKWLWHQAVTGQGHQPSLLRLASHPSSIVRSSVGCPAVALAKAGEAERTTSADKTYAACRTPYHTGNFRL